MWMLILVESAVDVVDSFVGIDLFVDVEDGFVRSWIFEVDS